MHVILRSKPPWEAEILRQLKDVDSGTIEPMTLIEARRELSSALE